MLNFRRPPILCGSADCNPRRRTAGPADRAMHRPLRPTWRNNAAIAMSLRQHDSRSRHERLLHKRTTKTNNKMAAGGSVAAEISTTTKEIEFVKPTCMYMYSTLVVRARKLAKEQRSLPRWTTHARHVLFMHAPSQSQTRRRRRRRRRRRHPSSSSRHVFGWPASKKSKNRKIEKSKNQKIKIGTSNDATNANFDRKLIKCSKM